MDAPDYDDDDLDVCEMCGGLLQGLSNLCAVCDALFDCALGPDGQCMKAGSEECDWECPNSHGPLFAGSNEWHLRHISLPVADCDCGDCKKARRRPLGEQRR